MWVVCVVDNVVSAILFLPNERIRHSNCVIGKPAGNSPKRTFFWHPNQTMAASFTCTAVALAVAVGDQSLAAIGKAKSESCPTVSGWSFPHSRAIANAHNPAKDIGSCCSACRVVATCVTWTFHPGNGCWLHGAYADPPLPVWCGDGALCVTGSRGAPLPPVPPPPRPSPPTPPPVVALARPSEAHLLFHEDNMGAICHFGMQTFVDRKVRTRPAVPFPLSCARTAAPFVGYLGVHVIIVAPTPNVFACGATHQPNLRAVPCAVGVPPTCGAA
jgi:hypothetical protein